MSQSGIKSGMSIRPGPVVIGNDMNGGSNKLKGLKKLKVMNDLESLRRLMRSERHVWWKDGYRRSLEHFQSYYQHNQLCCRHHRLYYGCHPRMHSR